MKTLKFLLLAAFAICGVSANAQNILDPFTFDRMIRQDITYAITGESTPITGIKLDISKPEGTISGMFPLKKNKLKISVFSFDLKGGVSDKSFSLFKGDGYPNSAYEFKPSFHFFSNFNAGKYGKKYDLENQIKKASVLTSNAKVDAENKILIDTIYVVTRIYNQHLKNLKIAKPIPSEITGASDEHKKIAAVLIPKLLNQPNLKIDITKDWDEILKPVTPATLKDGEIELASFNDAIVKMFTKYQTSYEGLTEETQDKKIKNANGIWTRKKYFWVTLSPLVRTDKTNEYYTQFEGKDSLYFKPGFRWSVGGSLYANRYWLTPGKVAVLLRGGVSIMRTNNLVNLSSYNYETRSPIHTQGTAVTQKIKTGSAYDNSDILGGYDYQFNTELYILPLKHFIPGGYFSATISSSKLLNLPKIIGRENDTFKASVEGGVVLNINNREKDKSVLSIIPYFRYEDLTDKIRTPIKTKIQETRKEFQDRNMFVGIKVGIPITLPKQSK